MRNKNKIFTMYSSLFIISLIATVTMRTVALFLHFSEKNIYFNEKTLISAADYILVAACILFISYIFTARRDTRLIPNFTSPATYIPTGIISVALIFMTVALFRRSYQTVQNVKALKSFGSSDVGTEILILIVLIVTAVLSVLSVIHFALTALVDAPKSRERANLGLCTILFLSLYTIYLYFSAELPINAPNKMLDQMVYLFSAVFFLYETRLSLGREKWRQYVAFGFIAASIAAYSSVPAIIYYFAEDTVISNTIYESVLSFALFIFITARIFLTPLLMQDKESSVVLALSCASDTREELVSPKPRTPEVIDVEGEALSDTDLLDNQISIEDSELLVSNETGETELVATVDEPEQPLTEKTEDEQ